MLLLKITLGAIDQSLATHNVTYCESIAQAMIECADLYIGGTLVQRIPSDMLAIYSEISVTQSKQAALRKLVGKPDQVFPVYTDLYEGIRDDRVSSSQVDTSYMVDLPFYFHEHPELAIPLHAITKQEVEIAIRFRKAEECIFEVNPNVQQPNPAVATSHYIGQKPPGLIKSVQLSTEMVSLKDKKFPNIILVGKGVTFDSGGLDLKPAKAMEIMKKDMGGSAVVLGIAYALMSINFPINLIFLFILISFFVSSAVAGCTIPLPFLAEST